MENRDNYRRKSCIINNAIENLTVNKFIESNYQYLQSLLINTEDDRDIFQDTYLNITRTYKPNLKFIDEFIRQFRNLKIAYHKKDAEMKCIIKPLSDAISKEE